MKSNAVLAPLLVNRALEMGRRDTGVILDGIDRDHLLDGVCLTVHHAYLFQERTRCDCTVHLSALPLSTLPIGKTKANGTGHGKPQANSLFSRCFFGWDRAETLLVSLWKSVEIIYSLGTVNINNNLFQVVNWCCLIQQLVEIFTAAGIPVSSLNRKRNEKPISFSDHTS